MKEATMASRRKWTDEDVERETREHVERLGRMPSMNELRTMGGNDLVAQITRRGGVRLWAKRIGASLKDSETKRGQDVELLVASELVMAGFVVERTSARAPFDLLVSGVRVDVKSSQYAEYAHTNGSTVSRGYFFGINKREPTCDLYVLACMNGDRIVSRYYVPSSAARVSTLTITPTGKRYAQYRENLAALTNMVMMKAGLSSRPRPQPRCPA